MSITEQIKTKLGRALSPIHMELKNVSHLHEGHAGHDGSGESHFNLLIVSEKFTGVSRIERQRMIYGLLREEMQNGLHALSIKALSLSEYSNK